MNPQEAQIYEDLCRKHLTEEPEGPEDLAWREGIIRTLMILEIQLESAKRERQGATSDWSYGYDCKDSVMKADGKIDAIEETKRAVERLLING